MRCDVVDVEKSGLSDRVWLPGRMGNSTEGALCLLQDTLEIWKVRRVSNGHAG
ncbi:uncharacterized protein RAG0_15611 [Rhynchosporium agropyri]|uniref:Uncharacterized protein n=3 Tax=Rhynchosporium TaxID=38037 RepID=A0A1E1LZU0_RHYSE|nr:uncharacterized protein RAG0_15611 [Rhynchosporium agropyri]CZT12964.1 uncharacterized protein RCO7_15211 [Rhynchosporium commune]CZT42383.1 uncharacterized protein RSE6_02255 [Rhynchosporium secalis]